MGRLLTELGKRTADAGIPLVYHNHMNSMSQPPEGTAAIMDASDPRHVRLLLDVAHYQQGGGDAVKAVTQYRDRIGVVHIKDVVSPAPAIEGAPPRPYQFVELGRGTVNLKGVVAALNQIDFQGWGIIELDSVPDKARTPKDCAIISRDYLQQRAEARTSGAAVNCHLIERQHHDSTHSPDCSRPDSSASCSCPSLGAQKPAAPAKTALTAEETRAGWKMLFDGKTLNGWRGYKKPDATTSRWLVEDGMLTLPKNDGKDTHGARDLISTETFDHFELAWDWKIALAGNSGMKYFVLEDQDSAIGHEYQMIDDERHPDAKVGPKRQTSALYDVLAAANRPLKPAGEWNSQPRRRARHRPSSTG